MPPLAEIERERSRRSPLYWALRRRRINGRPFTVIPPLEEIYTSRHPRIIVRKAAQVFISEWLTNIGLWVADTGAGGRGVALYVFPASEQGDDFSKARIDKAIAESPWLSARTSLRNVGLKQVGPGYLYVRGGQSRRQMIGVDADVVLLDEVAEYVPGTIETFEKRLGSSLVNWMRAGSTPRYPSDEAGQYWDLSTQAEYHVRCSHCGRWQALGLLTHLNPETARVECPHCHGDMTADRLAPGRWEHAHAERPWQGFQVNKLLSPRADLGRLAATLLRVLDGRATVGQTQEFYNSDAGLPHLPEGGHLGADVLDACRELVPAYVMPGRAEDCYMGVDVGKRLHVRIDKREGTKRRAVYADSVRRFEDLDELMARYDVARCVIDANPETRAAQAFCERWSGRVYLAYYPNWTDTQHSELCVWDTGAPVVRINRTAALDAVIQRVANRQLILPANARELGGSVDRAGLGEYYRHMASPIRVLEKDRHGNDVARYDQNGPDHYAHAEVYAEIAASNEGGGIAGMEDEPEPAEEPGEPAGPWPTRRRRVEPTDEETRRRLEQAGRPAPAPPGIDLSGAALDDLL